MEVVIGQLKQNKKVVYFVDKVNQTMNYLGS